MKFSIGQRVELETPFKGYRTGEVVDYDFPYYYVELPNGKQIRCYEDELTAD